MIVCTNPDCKNDDWYGECFGAKHCEDCGGELVPAPKCACGTEIQLRLEVDLLRYGKERHCRGCGLQWTEQTLSTLMAENLRGLLAGVHKRFEVN